jgi:cytidyltransferase-like protein
MIKKRIYVDMVADLFHRGHVEFLKKAKKIVDNGYLIVGVHSNEDVLSYKRQPVFSVEDRVEIVSSCKYVDQVIENSPLVISTKFIVDNNIDVVVHGDDMDESTLQKFYPGPIDMEIMRTVPYYDKLSTTQIIEKISNRDSVQDQSLSVDNRYLSSLTDSEWNLIKKGHEPSKPFNMENRVDNLKNVKSILDENYIVFWICDGTLLGAVREKDFIKWDNEIDIDMFEEDLLKNFDFMREHFISQGFIVRGHKHVRGAKMNLYRNKEKISIRGLYLNPKYKKNSYRMSKAYKYPKKYFKKFSHIKLRGIYLRTPYPIKKYIRYVYGTGWKTPIKSKDICKRGWIERGVMRTSEHKRKYG